MQVYQKIVEEAEKFAKQVEEQTSTRETVVLVLGDTGSGKTTITALLDGKQLQVTKIGATVVLDLPNQVTGIGHRIGESETQSPVFHRSASGVLVLDCPGFKDTKGAETEILHSFRLFQLFKGSKNLKVKVVIVSPAGQLDSRGVDLVEVIRRVQQMFP